MHPKMINMTKLKRDPKIPTEKEKNFRLLLNAVNQLGLCVAINVKFPSIFRLSIYHMVKSLLFLNCFNGSINSTKTLLEDMFQDLKKIWNFQSPEWLKLMLVILLTDKKPSKRKPNLLEVKCRKVEEVLTQSSFKRMCLKLKSPDQSEVRLFTKVNTNKLPTKKKILVKLKVFNSTKKSLSKDVPKKNHQCKNNFPKKLTKCPKKSLK